jgi:flagellar biosynthesis activator protein FlaF
MARTAYGSQAGVRTDRSVEYDTFARITAALRKAADSAKQNFAAFAKALDDNRQLWTIIAADVSEAANGLPQALRAQIFYLAQFTVTQTSRILRGEAGADVLIEINTMVMRGLRSQEVAKACRVHSGSYPAASKKFWHSASEKRSHTVPTAFHRSS